MTLPTPEEIKHKIAEKHGQESWDWLINMFIAGKMPEKFSFYENEALIEIRNQTLLFASEVATGKTYVGEAQINFVGYSGQKLEVKVDKDSILKYITK